MRYLMRRSLVIFNISTEFTREEIFHSRMCSGESDEFFLSVDDGSSQGGNDGVEAAIIMAIVRCDDVGVGGNVAREDFDALMLEMGNVVGFVGECVSGSEDCDGAEVVFVGEDGVGDVSSDESRGSEDENVLVGHNRSESRNCCWFGV